jgi:hypothetical protein
MVGLMLIWALTEVSAQSVKLAWNANPESNIGGYIVHYGTESGGLSEIMDVGNTTTATLEGLTHGVTHYAAVQAYNTLGQYSDLSAEVSFVPRIKPPALVTNQSGATQPDIGSSLDFGLVRLGAIGDTQTFTVSNTGTTPLTGLRFEIDGGVDGNFLVTGIPVNPRFTRNGSFEQELDDWTHTGNLVSSTTDSATDGGRIARFSGYNKPNTGVLSQSIATLPGVTYQLAFDVGIHSFNSSPQKLRSTIRGHQPLVNDDFTLSGSGDGGFRWIARTLEFTADSTTTTITFADASSFTNGVDLVLDHIRVIAPAAPPPATGSPITVLAPGASTTFSVTFKPTSGGTRETLLSLMADAVPVVLYEVKLGGMGSIHLDSWLAQNGIQDGAAGNPDKDALNNLQEYAFGTNPQSPQAGAIAVGNNGQWVARGTPSFRILDPEEAEEGGFQGLFARRKDHASVNLRYLPQFSADLIQWVDATGWPETIGDDGEMEVIAITAPDTIHGMPVRFFRVGVDQGRPPTFIEWLASTGATSGTHGNPDGDALDNLQEFAFGTDPRTAGGKSVAEAGGLIASRGSPAVRVTYTPDPQLQGMFGRRKEHAAAALVYRPQFSADLQRWIDADATPVKLADDGEMEIVSVAAPPTIDGRPARFFRVGVQHVGQAVPFDVWLSKNPPPGSALINPPPDTLLHYAFGIAPDSNNPPTTVEESNGLLVARGFPAGRIATTPAFAFQGLFCRRIGHAALGLTYRPQFSTDLVTWQDAGEIPLVLTDDGEIEVVSVTAPATLSGQPARFFRVGVDHRP